MVKNSFLFSGQGGFFPGMGKEIFNKYESVKYVFSVFNNVIGEKVENYCFGEKAAFTKRDNKWIQLTITAVNIAYAYILKSLGISPEICLGHSLGEISALIFFEIVSLRDGVRITQKRGEIMEKFSKIFVGNMISVIGLEPERVEEIVQDVNKENLYSLSIANINAPRFITVSGKNNELYSLRQYILKKEKMVAAKPLDVGGPWHNPFLKDAAQEFSDFLNGIDFKVPKGNFFSITNLKLLRDPEEIKMSLSKQLISVVNWKKGIEILASKGYDNFIEVGPGKILKNLLRKISPDLKCETVISTIKKISNN